MVNALSYADRSRVYLTQAREELERGDLCQASEKAWGAAAEMVKAVAERRGWDHRGHRLLDEAVAQLASRSGSDELAIEYGNAGRLHTNFYEGTLPAYLVTLYTGQVERFVERLEAML